MSAEASFPADRYTVLDATTHLQVDRGVPTRLLIGIATQRIRRFAFAPPCAGTPPTA